MSDAFTAVKDVYENFQINLGPMLAATHNDTDHQTVVDQYLMARSDYNACLNKNFQDNDGTLKALTAQAEAVAAQLKKINTVLGDITKVINVATQAATVAGKIAAKVIA